MSILPQKTKRCSKCGEDKTIDEFRRDRSRKDGLSYWCKSCVREEERRWREANPDKAREACRRYREANPDKAREAVRRWAKANPDKKHEAERRWREANPDKIREAERRWYEANPDKEREKSRRWYEANPDKAHEKDRRWREANPDQARAIKHRRRARINGNGGTYTAQEWQDLCAKYDNRCLACGEKKPLTVDHVLPLKMGGSNDITNIQALCKSCNSKKGTKHIDYR